MKLTFPKWKVNGNENLLKLCPELHGQPEALDLLTQMLQLEPSKRITIKAALSHPFFTKQRSLTKVQESPLKSNQENSACYSLRNPRQLLNKENLFGSGHLGSLNNSVAYYEDAFNVIPPHLL